MSFNIETFNFPTVSDEGLAFPTLGVDPKLLKEAKKRGYYNGHSRWNDLASQLFFFGGELKLKKDWTPNKQRGLRYMKAFMGSWEPKHEEKEAIVALLLSELCE